MLGYKANRLTLLLGSWLLLAATAPGAPQRSASESQFTLWQLPEQTHSQMMCYVLRTGQGKLAVIDGGTTGDAAYLRGFLAALGNEVDYWFLTHQHSDHTGALAEILRAPRGLKISRIYGSYLPQAWLVRHGCQEEVDSDADLATSCQSAGTTVTDIAPGTVLTLDSVHFEILAARNPEFSQNNPVNNQSLVMRVSDSKKSVLFTGDLGEEGGDKLLKSAPRQKLRADYVQMAHHGQNGVNEAFYQAVAAKACLWPTPRWLWDNDSGKGRGSGPWQTLVVREWMEKLGVERHYVSAEGLHKID